MKKFKLLLLVSIFTMIFSSNILAEETTEKVHKQSFPGGASMNKITRKR